MNKINTEYFDNYALNLSYFGDEISDSVGSHNMKISKAFFDKIKRVVKFFELIKTDIGKYIIIIVFAYRDLEFLQGIFDKLEAMIKSYHDQEEYVLKLMDEIEPESELDQEECGLMYKLITEGNNEVNCGNFKPISLKIRAKFTEMLKDNRLKAQSIANLYNNVKEGHEIDLEFRKFYDVEEEILAFHNKITSVGESFFNDVIMKEIGTYVDVNLHKLEETNLKPKCQEAYEIYCDFEKAKEKQNKKQKSLNLNSYLKERENSQETFGKKVITLKTQIYHNKRMFSAMYKGDATKVIQKGLLKTMYFNYYYRNPLGVFALTTHPELLSADSIFKYFYSVNISKKKDDSIKSNTIRTLRSYWNKQKNLESLSILMGLDEGKYAKTAFLAGIFESIELIPENERFPLLLNHKFHLRNKKVFLVTLEEDIEIFDLCFTIKTSQETYEKNKEQYKKLYSKFSPEMTPSDECDGTVNLAYKFKVKPENFYDLLYGLLNYRYNRYECQCCFGYRIRYARTYTALELIADGMTPDFYRKINVYKE